MRSLREDFLMRVKWTMIGCCVVVDTNKKANRDAVGFLSESGGAEEDRTPDLRIANATLSQLSYRPTLFQPSS